MNLTSEIKRYLVWSFAPMGLLLVAHWAFIAHVTPLAPIILLIPVGAAVLYAIHSYQQWQRRHAIRTRTEIDWEIEDDAHKALLDQLESLKTELLRSVPTENDDKNLRVAEMAKEVDAILTTLRGHSRFTIRHSIHELPISAFFAHSFIIDFLLDYLRSKESPRAERTVRDD